MSGPHVSPAPSPAPSKRARGPKPQSRPVRLFTTNSTSSSRPRLDSLTPGPTGPPRPSTRTCPNPTCMEPNNVVQEDDGSWICHHCGTIASEHSHIVSDIQFAETASGAPAVQGQYIGADQTHARSAVAGRRPGYAAGGGDGPNSKQLTELSARRDILALMQNLGEKGVVVAQSFIDPALGLFKLALQHNFVQGRSISTVAAVALYLQCRRSKETNEVMLIDIAECINVNVFVLGKMYTKLIQKLYGTTNHSTALTDKIDTINPENLIRRFAKGLDFPKREDRNQIVRDAIRLVQRMDRDWMATGRRPAGICGAALILAARMNNFRRTVREVVLIVKVTEITINKRLEEFSYTDSSNLTVEQFRGITLERDCDPPAFYRARQENTPKRRKKRKRAPETAAEIEGDEPNDDDDDDDQAEFAAEPTQKRRRIDRDGFAIPEIPIDPALRRATPRVVGSATTPAEDLLELATTAGIPIGESPIDEALTLAVNSAISEMASEEQSSQLLATSGTLEAAWSHQRDADAASSEPHPGEPPRRRRGRPKGAKNWQPPPESAAELALEAEIEAEIEGELRKASESGLVEPLRLHAKSTEPASSSNRSPPPLDQSGPARSSVPPPSLVSDLSAEPYTPPSSHPATGPAVTTQADSSTTEPSYPSSTTPPTGTSSNRIVHNPPGVEDTTLAYLDGDPEVSSCILSEDEKLIKERIWVTENADWLRKDHVKKIKAELQAAADREAGIDPDDTAHGRGKGRGRKKKRGRLGDVSYLDQGDKAKDGQTGGDNGEEGGAARSAREATLKMMAHRGYSRRVNYDVFKALFPEEEEAARQRSSRSSTSTTAAEQRRGSPARATASGSGSPASTPAVDKDTAPRADKAATTGAPPSPRPSAPSPTLSAPASATSTGGSAAPSTARSQPKPRPQARKAVRAVATPIAPPGNPPPTAPSGPSRAANAPTSTSILTSAATQRLGQAPGGQQGWEARGARRQAKDVADTVVTKGWDEAAEEEEVLDEAEEEERAWRARMAPKDGPALANASAAEGVTRGTAVRLATPASRGPSVGRQLPIPAVTQPPSHVLAPAPTSSTRAPGPTIDLGEEEIIGSIDDSPLTSLRSSVVGADVDGDEEDEDDAADYVDVDEDDDDDDDDDVEAAFAGRFARRSESFDDDDDDDEDMDDI